MRRPPVGEQQRPGGIQIAGEEPGERGRDVPRAGREVDHGRARVRAHEPLEEHRHSGRGDAGVLIEHEGVPERHEGSRQGGHHDGVVDVGDDAELDVGTDDPDRRLDGDRLGGAEGCLMPAGRETHGDLRVDHATAVGQHLDAFAAHLDDDGHVADWHAREAAPAPDALLASPPTTFRRFVGCHRLAQQHSTEHPDPLGRAVARVGHDRRQVASAPGPALPDVVDPVFEARGTMPDLAFP